MTPLMLSTRWLWLNEKNFEVALQSRPAHLLFFLTYLKFNFNMMLMNKDVISLLSNLKCSFHQNLQSQWMHRDDRSLQMIYLLLLAMMLAVMKEMGLDVFVSGERVDWTRSRCVPTRFRYRTS